MQIQLKQSEIEEAVRLWIKNQGIALDDQQVEVSFTAGRKNNGITADIDIQSTPKITPSGPVARSEPSLTSGDDTPVQPLTSTKPASDSDAKLTETEQQEDEELETIPEKDSLFGS